MIIQAFGAFLPLFFGSVLLVNVLGWYRESGLPLIPALLVVEAGIFAVLIGGYMAYEFLIKPLIATRRLKKPVDGYEWFTGADAPEFKYSASGSALFLWLFAANWIAVIAFAASDRWTELNSDIEQTPVLAVAYGVFPLIGLITVIVAIRQTVRWARFGRSQLQFGSGSCFVGEPVAARLHTRIQAAPWKGQPNGVSKQGGQSTRFKTGSFRIRLVGFERHWYAASAPVYQVLGTGVRLSESPPFYETEITVRARDVSSHLLTLCVPFFFTVPGDQPPSGRQSDDTEVVWKLIVESKTGVTSGFYSEFEFPVYARWQTQVRHGDLV